MTSQLKDRYTLGIPLGRSAAGAIWRASEEGKSRPVAVAVLDFQGLDGADPDFLNDVREIFVRDMTALKRVRHPNVVNVFDVGEDEAGHAYAAMELLDGVSLEEWLDGDVTRDQLLRLISSAVLGLAAVHRAGVIHGDIEPGKIRVLDNGIPKLLGFGLNRASSRVAGSPWNQTSGVNISIAFSAPEQARGELDAFTDVYGMGLLLHQALCGGLPDKVSDEDLPKVLRDALAGALAEDPTKRFTTEELRRAIGKALLVLRGTSDAKLPLVGGHTESTQKTLPGSAVAPAIEQDDDSLATVEMPIAGGDEDDELDNAETVERPIDDDEGDEDAEAPRRPSEPAPAEQARSKFQPRPPAALKSAGERALEPPPPDEPASDTEIEIDDSDADDDEPTLRGDEPANAPPGLPPPSVAPAPDAPTRNEHLARDSQEEVERVSLSDALEVIETGAPGEVTKPAPVAIPPAAPLPSELKPKAPMELKAEPTRVGFKPEAAKVEEQPAKVIVEPEPAKVVVEPEPAKVVVEPEPAKVELQPQPQSQPQPQPQSQPQPSLAELDPQPEPQPAQDSSPPRAAVSAAGPTHAQMIGVSVTALAAGAALMWAFSGATPTPAPQPQPVERSAPASVEAASPPTLLELIGLPAHAVVRIDSEVVEVHDRRVPFPTDSERHRIEVVGEGRPMWARELSIDGPMSIRLAEGEALSEPEAGEEVAQEVDEESLEQELEEAAEEEAEPEDEEEETAAAPEPRGRRELTPEQQAIRERRRAQRRAEREAMMGRARMRSMRPALAVDPGF